MHPEPEWNSGSETEDNQSKKELLNTSPEEDVNEEVINEDANEDTPHC